MVADNSVAQDTFEDADEMTTPRPRGRSSSPEATRSLTDRRASITSTHLKDKDIDGTVHPSPHDAGRDSQHEARSAHKKTGSHAEQRISVNSMDDVSLDEGQSRLPHNNYL